MGTTFTLPDVASLGDLRTYLGRAARVEDGSVRLIADSGVLAVYTAILYPLGLLDELPTVLGLRTFSLAEPATIDAVVPLASLQERLRLLAEAQDAEHARVPTRPERPPSRSNCRSRSTRSPGQPSPRPRWVGPAARRLVGAPQARREGRHRRGRRGRPVERRGRDRPPGPFRGLGPTDPDDRAPAGGRRVRGGEPRVPRPRPRPGVRDRPVEPPHDVPRARAREAPGLVPQLLTDRAPAPAATSVTTSATTSATASAHREPAWLAGRMHVFLTGASGYIGSSVLRALVAHGHEVTAIVRSDEKAQRVRDAAATRSSGTSRTRRRRATRARDRRGRAHRLGRGRRPRVHRDGPPRVRGHPEAVRAHRRDLHLRQLDGHLRAVADRPARADRLARRERGRRPIELGAHDHRRPGHRLRPRRRHPGDVRRRRRARGPTRRRRLAAVDDGAHRRPRRALRAGAPPRRAGRYVVAATGDNPTLREIAEAGAHGSPVVAESVDESRSRLGDAFADALLLHQEASGAHARAAFGWNPTRPSLVEDMADGSYVR